MMRQNQIQEALKTNFPQFSDKKLLIDYYVAFQFPAKQMKMVKWWQKVIQFLIQYDNKIYINYQQLVNYVSVYNLKPTPLQAVIKHLAKNQILVPESEYAKKKFQEELASQSKPWYSNIFSFVTGPPKEDSIFSFLPNEKIFSKKLKQFKKQQARKVILDFCNHKIKSEDEFIMLRKLESELRIDIDSVKQILRELEDEKYIRRQAIRQKQFILFSHNPQDLESKQWRQLEGIKYGLRTQIDKFQAIISEEEKKIVKLVEKAKENLSMGNKSSAKTNLHEKVSREKKISTVATRKHLLQNQLTQLQYNQMNKSTLDLLEQAQNLFKQTMIDQSRLEEAIEKNAEIEQISKQTNEKFQDLSKRQEDEVDVESLLRELENEVKTQKQAKVDLPQVRVIIQSVSQEKMSIQQQDNNAQLA